MKCAINYFGFNAFEAVRQCRAI